MSFSLNYGAINAKIKAMRSKFLSYDDFQFLANSNTVVEVASKLKDYSSYGVILENLEPSKLRRGFIEDRLIDSTLFDHKKIYKFISDFNTRKYLDSYNLLTEISILKFILVSIYDEREIESFSDVFKKVMVEENDYDFEKLLDTTTVSDFIKLIPSKSMKEYLTKGSEEEYNLFSLQTRMDIFYYVELIKMQNKYLSSQDKKAIEVINGCEIDLKNIVWIFRLKSYYNFLDGEIFTYLVPHNYKLKKEQIFKMVEAKTNHELMSEIKKTYYGHFFEEKKSLERSFYDAMSYIYNLPKSKNDNPLSLISSYIFEKNIEIKNIFSVIEGVRYSLKKDEIFKYLIIKEKKEVVSNG